MTTSTQASSTPAQPTRLRFFLMALGVLSLLAGLWSALQRLGFGLPSPQPLLPLAHGGLMVGGFLGTLISLERAVALGKKWMYAAPLLSGLAGVALIAGLQNRVAPLLMTLASLLLMLIFIVIVRRQTALFTFVMALGSISWLIGNVFWLAGSPIYGVVHWWMAFLVLTIVGERLELSRLLQPSRMAHITFQVSAAVLVGGAVLARVTPAVGSRIFGAGLILLALWLLVFDIARRTVKQPGLTRFVALCLLSGYVWLGAGGVFALAFGQVIVGLQYDAVLHCVFLGFVFSMIFGHAPIIFPAVLKLPVPFSPRMYIFLGLLHASLLMRIASDLTYSISGRQWAGFVNVIAVLAYFGYIASSVPGALRTAGARQPG